MRYLGIIISMLALVATVLPSVLFLMGNISMDSMKWVMIVATVVWFVVTPFWMNKPRKNKPVEEPNVI
jgi:hypothetical protein